MRFEDLNWMDIEKYLAQDDRLMVVLGACEQHAYLSVLSDVKIPQALADAASLQTGVLVAPALNFGSSPYFLDYPGTLSLRISTLLDMVEDIIRSAYRQGFRKFLILNGHGGNDPVRARLYELMNHLEGTRIAWYSWWLSHSVLELAQEYDLKPSHANWLEAFAFTRVAELPQEAKTPPNIPGLMGAAEARRVFGDGSFGGPYNVQEIVMEELFKTALEDVLRLVKFD
jgi:creatinine amidohydrolase